MEQGGDINIRSDSENSINAAGVLETYSDAGTAGNVNLTSPGNVNISSIISRGMEQGGDIQVNSERGEINSTGDIDSYSKAGRGGNIKVNAPERVTLGDVSSYGMEKSGDLRIESRTAKVNTGNVKTQAPQGDSGSIIINGTGVGTGDLSSIGTTSAGDIEVEATRDSIRIYDIEMKSDGTIGILSLKASEDVNAKYIYQTAGEGNTNINTHAGRDQNIGNITQIAKIGDTNNSQAAGRDQNIGDVTQTAGGNTDNIQTAGRDQNIGDVTQTAGGNTNNIQTAGRDQNIGDVTQTAGGNTNNSPVSYTHLTLPTTYGV